MFAGVFAHAGAAPAVDIDRLAEAIDPFGQADHVGRWNDGSAMVVAAHRINTAPSRSEHMPHRSGSMVVAHWGRLDNRSRLIARLGLGRGATDAQILAAAYARDGIEFVSHLRGAFSFVIFDQARRRAVAARDQIGIRPLYLATTDRQVALAATATAFHAIDGIATEPDPEWMLLYLIGISDDHRRTPWSDVTQVPPGHHLQIDLGDGSARLERYFAFDADIAPASGNDATHIADYRQELDRAVLQRTESLYPVGIETSGGIDSSTCLASAATQWKRLGRPLDQLHAYGRASLEREPEFIHLTSYAHGIDNTHIFDRLSGVGDDDALLRSIDAVGHPVEHPNALGHTTFYRHCESLGIRTLISGFGGDEAVTNPATPAAAELAATRRYLALWRTMPGNPITQMLRSARALAHLARRGDPDLHAHVARQRWPHFALNPDAVIEYGLEERYIDHHRQDWPDSVNDWVVEGRLNKPFVATRTSHCSLVAASYGVEYRWPLLDVDLIERWLASPTGLKRRDGHGRYLHRQAMADIVPAPVLWDAPKHMGRPINPRPLDPVPWALESTEAMHPSLAELVDRPRLVEVARRLDDNPSDYPPILSASRHGAAIRGLNAWLERYHP